MPMHDWTSVDPSIYHHFHQHWIVAVADVLNAGLLPPGLSALIERHTGPVMPRGWPQERRKAERFSADDIRPAPGTCQVIEVQQAGSLARRANRIVLRHRLRDPVCVIEVVSPGHKRSRAAVRQFIDETMEFLRAGVNVLLVDPLPPTPRDPQSLHKLIWDEIDEVPFEVPPGEPLLLATYRVGDDLGGLMPAAFVETFRVGAAMPDMPAWIDVDSYVPVPLERTYQAAWDICPADYRYLVEHGRLPDE